MYLLIDSKKYDIKDAVTFKERLCGLMGQKNISYGMMFKRCNSIHTFFMKENIDIIGINNENVVIYKYENLGINRIIKINNPISDTTIIEMPHNSTKNIKLNEKITIYS